MYLWLWTSNLRLDFCGSGIGRSHRCGLKWSVARTKLSSCETGSDASGIESGCDAPLNLRMLFLREDTSSVHESWRRNTVPAAANREVGRFRSSNLSVLNEDDIGTI
jgi:hypothetical protein